ncbi:hypothetical protein [Pontiella sulfatireligans]|uniref:hypothetical protein n=1 Tax=Pontiella sulfatireligans TaxID=2750658 RepID=UPI0014441AB7|nr:hypothetical protein [Pontiella sulfatireligans]
MGILISSWLLLLPPAFSQRLQIHRVSDKPLIPPSKGYPGHCWFPNGNLNPAPVVAKVNGRMNLLLFYRASMPLAGTGNETGGLGLWSLPLSKVSSFSDLMEQENYTKQPSAVLTVADYLRAGIDDIGIEGSGPRLADPNIYVDSLPSRQTDILYLTHKFKYVGQNPNSIYTVAAKSTDGGQSWTPLGRLRAEGKPVSMAPAIWRHDNAWHAIGGNGHVRNYYYQDDPRYAQCPTDWKLMGEAWKPQTAQQQFRQITTRVTVEGEFVYAWVAVTPRHGKMKVHNDWPETVSLYRAKLSELGKNYAYRKKDGQLTWEEYPYNPVFIRGAAGTQEEAALWSFNVVKIPGEKFHLVCWEAAGSWNAPGGSRQSDRWRDAWWAGPANGKSPYGYAGYNRTGYSSCFAAKLNASSLGEVWDADIKKAPLFKESFVLRNKETKKYLLLPASVGSAVEQTANIKKAAVFSAVPAYRNAKSCNFWYMERAGSNGLVLASPGIGKEEDVLLQAMPVDIDPMNPSDINAGKDKQWHPVLYEHQGDALIGLQNRFTGCFLDASSSGNNVKCRKWADSLSQKWLLCSPGTGL